MIQVVIPVVTPQATILTTSLKSPFSCAFEGDKNERDAMLPCFA
jgi:hypothetical protein